MEKKCLQEQNVLKNQTCLDTNQTVSPKEDTRGYLDIY